MADYFLVLDGADFEGRLRPALADSWRRRSFEPCRALCADLVPAARAYAERYHTGGAEPLLAGVARGLAFDRTFWRTLAGEVLLFSAVDVPELQANADTLCCLLAPGRSGAGPGSRAELAPIEQVFRGSRDLTFGGAVYRPERAGYNNRDDVARLADYLASLRPERWDAAGLVRLPDLADEGEREDELAFVREWFPVLRELYLGARDRGHVLVLESIY